MTNGPYDAQTPLARIFSYGAGADGLSVDPYHGVLTEGDFDGWISGFTSPPNATPQFNVDMAGGIDYQPQDGFAGVDPFTFQKTNPITGTTSNTGKGYIGRANLKVYKILNGAPNGTLTDAEKNTTGAYVPVQSSINYDDLLPVEIKPMPYDGTFTIGYNPAVISVWTNDKMQPGTQIGFGGNTSTITLKAGESKKLWVAGVGALANTTLTLGWQSNLKIQDKYLTGSDSVKINVFQWSGPRNVPGLSRYSEIAYGAAPGDDSKWIGGGQMSTLLGTGHLLGDVDFGRYEWADKAAVGTAAYQAAPGYVWDYDVNIVHVKVSNLNDAAIRAQSGLPRNDEFGADPNLANSPLLLFATGRNSNNGWGVTWSASVTLTGPKGGRGVDHIRTGFIQTITDATWSAKYEDGKTLTADYASKVPMNDSRIDPVHTAPWMDLEIYDPNSMFIGSRHGPAYNPPSYKRTIFYGDAPTFGVPLTSSQETDPTKITASTPGKLTAMTVELSFLLKVVSVTTDFIPVPGDETYEEMARVGWKFNADGTPQNWQFGSNGLTSVAWVGTPGVAGYDVGLNQNWSDAFKGTPYLPQPWTISPDELRRVKFN